MTLYSNFVLVVGVGVTTNLLLSEPQGLTLQQPCSDLGFLNLRVPLETLVFMGTGKGS